jgi:hypothetical protein
MPRLRVHEAIHSLPHMSLWRGVSLSGKVIFSLSLSLSLWLYSPLKLGRFFSFLILYLVGRTPWTADQPVARPLPTHGNTNRIKAHRHPCLEWDSSPRSQCWRAKTVDPLDRAPTVIGTYLIGLSTIDQGWSRCWGRLRPSPTIYIHTYLIGLP